jgi:hypothetical protein
MIRAKRLGVLATVAATVVAFACTDAQAKVPSPQPRIFAPHFQQIAQAPGDQLYGGGGLAFVETGSPAGPTGELFSSAPAGTSVPAPPSCITSDDSTPVMGGGVLLDSCDELELWHPATSTWQTVNAAAEQATCALYQEATGMCEPIAVGRRWIRYMDQCYHCTANYFLVSTATGALRSDPTGGQVAVALNAQDPARKRCAPISTTPGNSVTFAGNRALVGGPRGYRIEQCGSTQRIKLPTGTGLGTLGTPYAQIAIAGKLIIWIGSQPTRRPPPQLIVDGVSGATDQQFAIRLPAAARTDGAAPSLALTSTRLFVQTGPGTIVSAPLPAALR